ncbi:hypothetical protein I549_4409 [Mycobacterium avium subsp. avium 2285 (R)]|nr:hypothetical protein I549_4409 [Mycobacterium avium subsp. avium 2285 (R)]
MSYQPFTLPVEDLTVGRLAAWIDQVRHCGAVDDQSIGLEVTDADGNRVDAHDLFVEIDQ